MSTLQKAIEIATAAHKGQFDKSGKEYIGEPVYSIYAARQENPNAYDPWTEEADEELKSMWSEGASTPDIAVHFGRKQARDLKEFLVLRDTHPAFEKVRERGNIGIPCFIKEDGTVIISLKKFDDSFEPVYAEGAACNLDGTGC